MKERIEEFVRRAANLDFGTPESRRREDLTERVLSAGRTREDADRIYDVAIEEGVDPGVALELVLTGVGVRDLGGPVPDHWQETQVDAPPDWVSEPVSAPADPDLELRMRTTFRRLRSITERAPSPAEAVRIFAREPDVGAVDY